MCFGYDGEGALRRSLEEKGASRRSLFRGAAAGVAGAAVLGSGLAGAAEAATGAAHDHDHGSRRSIPHHKISIQLYTLRAALGGEPGFDTVLTRLAQYGYERVEMAGYYGRTARQLRTFLDDLGIRASSSHDGLTTDSAALQTKLENAVTLGQRYVVVPYLNDPTLEYWQRA